MIKHIVMWKLKEEAEGNNKEENISIVKDKLNALTHVIEEILSLEVGENFNPKRDIGLNRRMDWKDVRFCLSNRAIQ